MSYDLVIRNGTVIDGSGLPRYRADVGVNGGKITTIGRIRGESARETIDAEGHVDLEVAGGNPGIQHFLDGSRLDRPSGDLHHADHRDDERGQHHQRGEAAGHAFRQPSSQRRVDEEPGKRQ